MPQNYTPEFKKLYQSGRDYEEKSVNTDLL